MNLKGLNPLTNDDYTTRALLLEQNLRLDGVLSRGRTEGGG